MPSAKKKFSKPTTCPENAEAWTWSERSPPIPSYSPARWKVSRSTLAALLSTNA